MPTSNRHLQTVEIQAPRSSWAWRSPAFRRFAWWIARSGGHLRQFLSWSRNLVAAAVGFALLLLPFWTELRDLGQEYLRNTSDAYLGVTAALILVLFLRHRVQKRYLVSDFQNHLGGKNGAPDPALSALLRHELASISAVFRTIDEAATDQTHRSIKLDLEVNDIGAELEKTIGEEVTINVGTFKLSISKLTKLLRVSHGPTITGNLHREGCGLVLTVELSGGGKRGSWRVVEADLGEKERTRRLAPQAMAGDGSSSAACDAEDEAVAFALVRQAAYRIAAQIAPLGSPRWEAVRAFTEGLRAYRKVSRSDMNRDIELRQAERHFLDALRADRSFAWGHFNLGVVYSRLREYDAALAAFRRSIETDPNNFAPYLGLGTAYFDKGMAILDLGNDRPAARECFLQAAVYAGRAIAIKPHEPRPWNGLAAAQTLFLWQGDKPAGPEVIPAQSFRELVAHYHTAVALAFRQLCRAQLSGGASSSAEEAKAVTVLCLENLAEVFYEQQTAGHRGDELRQAAALLEEAHRLAPRKPSLHFALGKILASRAGTTKSTHLERAREELYEVFGDGLDPVSGAARWAWLLAIDASLLEAERSRPAVPGSRGKERMYLEGTRRAFAITLDLAVPPEALILRDHSLEVEKSRSQPDPELARYRTHLRRIRREIVELLHLPWLAVGSTAHGRVAGLLAALDAFEHLWFSTEGASTREAATQAEGAALPREVRAWVQAQRLIREARRLHIEWPEQAIPLLYDVIRSLTRQHARQIKRQGLDALLARAYLALGDRLSAAERCSAWGRRKVPSLPINRADCLRRALDHAFRAVALEPESAPRRLVLSQVHFELGDYPQAEAERQAALSLGPPFALLVEHRVAPEVIRRNLALLALAHGEGEPGAATQKAARELNHLCEMLEASPFPPVFPNASQPRPLFFDEHAAIHLALGRLYLATQPQQAVNHLWIAHQSAPETGAVDALLRTALSDPSVLTSVRALIDGSGAGDLPGWVQQLGPPVAERPMPGAAPPLAPRAAA